MPNFLKHQEVRGRWQLHGSTQSGSSDKDGANSGSHKRCSCLYMSTNKNHCYREEFRPGAARFFKRKAGKDRRRQMQHAIAAMINQHFLDIEDDCWEEQLAEHDYGWDYIDEDWDRYNEPEEETEDDYVDDYRQKDYDDYYDREYVYL